MSPPDEAELESLVRRFSKLVRAVASRVGGHTGRQLADDVEQHVFLSVWKQLQREQIIENPSSYIYRCAVRETVRLLKADRHEEPTMAADESADHAAPDVASAHEERLRLKEALRSLPIDRRRAVQAYLAGFSIAEVMEMYGWSYQRARNLSARGMADLRARLRTKNDG